MKVNQLGPRVSTLLAAVMLIAGCSAGQGAASSGPIAAPPGGGTAAPASGATAGSASASAEPGAGGGATGQPVTDIGRLSSLLGPGDFSAAGVSGAGNPTVNSSEPGAVYVVYAGKSGATGGIELDVVVGASATGMSDVFTSMAAPLITFAAQDPLNLTADDAKLRTDNPIDSGGTWAGIAVRKGRLVFLISMASSPAAKGQLVSLAKLVLDRASSLE